MRPRFRHLLGPCVAGLLAACSSQSATGPIQPTPLQQSQDGSSATASGITYKVASSLADTPTQADPLLRPTITVTAKLRNDRADAVTLQYGACSVSLVAYANADRRGAPVWRSDASEPWEGTYGRGCIAILIGRTLASGAEFTLGAYSSRVIEILGDSLPNGHYYFAATLGVSSAPNGISLPAGDFDLTLTRPPLRDVLTHDFITYKATSTVTGGAVQGKVTATLTDAGGYLVQYPKECVVELVAYRTRDRRDSAPWTGAPDWRATRACASGWQQTPLERGQSISFDATASAREILGSSLPEGTYYFVAIVHTRTRNVWLAAGSGELRR
jgi:hypothetical protein